MRRLCLAIVALLALAAPAAAGGCCGNWAPAYDIQPVVPVSTYRFDAPPPVRQVYVVNQGPVLSGPGIYTYTNHYVPSFVPTYASVCGGYGGCGHAVSYGCCGQSYGYASGCCGQGYSYNYGYGCGSGYGCGGYGYGGYSGYVRGYWPATRAVHRSSGGQGYWHRYHVWLHRHVPHGTVAPSRGY